MQCTAVHALHPVSPHNPPINAPLIVTRAYCVSFEATAAATASVGVDHRTRCLGAPRALRSGVTVQVGALGIDDCTSQVLVALRLYWYSTHANIVSFFRLGVY